MTGASPRRAILATLLVVTTAHADVDPRLRVTHQPPPRTLRMRPRVAQTPVPAVDSESPPTTTDPGSAPDAATTPDPATAAPTSTSRVVEDRELAAVRELDRSVSFSIDVGYQVDAANASGRASLGRPAPTPGRDYAALRSYGFGEVFGSTRGLGLASLSTYFAARFQVANRLQLDVMPGQTVPVAAPIATWFERSGVEIRTAWSEVRDFLPKRWGLSRLRIRGGSQHIYGPWVMHMDGFTVSYDGPILTLSIYSGLRHSDYTRDQSDQRPTVAGSSIRVDLRGLPRPIPIAVRAELLGIGESSTSVQTDTTTSMFQADWRPRRDVAVIGQVRLLNGKSASQRLELRARYRQVTNFVVDLTRRTANDWRWDPSLSRPDSNELLAARRYLDLGPVVPQLTGSVRAGTLIAENLDLLVRAAGATNVRERDALETSFSVPYVELGGAFEARVRRAVAVGASLLFRDSQRRLPDTPMEDLVNIVQPLPALGARGEDRFTEAGTTLRLTLGARRFSSLVELYGRRTKLEPLYLDPLLEIPTSDLRFGGRVTVDAWVGQRVRLFAAYDLSSGIDLAPEISGYRSLRLMMSGVY